MRNGWHVIAGWQVYVKDNCVTHGVKPDNNNNLVPAYPYRKRWRYSFGKRYQDGWDNCTGLTVSAFKSGVYRGTICMF